MEGAESLALQQVIDEQLPSGPHLILHLGAVDFLDSSGLGLLVRYVTRTRNAHGGLKLCALPAKIVQVLDATHLRRVFEAHESEADAINAFYQRTAPAGIAAPVHADILCVHGSTDVQAYIRGLLTEAGIGVMSAGNLPDGLVLLQATQPKIVIAAADLRASRETRTGERFNALADALTVIELPADFSRLDAGEAGSRLLDQVREAMGGVPPDSPQR